MKNILIINASLGKRSGASVLVSGGLVEEVGSRRTLGGIRTLDARGCAVLPGLWDHHTHLRSAAARRRSLDVKSVTDPHAFSLLLQEAARRTPEGRWLRVVGYDDGALGDLDAGRLQHFVPTSVPIRVQHRSGHQWVLNPAAITAVQEATRRPVPYDGVIFDDDDLLAAVPAAPSGDAAVVREAQLLARQGCVGATDMTATTDRVSALALVKAVRPWLRLGIFGQDGAAPGAIGVRNPPGHATAGGIPTYGTKIIVADHNLPSPEELVRRIKQSRPGPVALHAVTAEALVLALWALEACGGKGDRIEHAFLAPADYPRAAAASIGALARPYIGVHPGFLWSQGNRLARALDNSERADYQRLRSWHEAGFTLLGGSDAPFGTGNLWRAMQCAVDRLAPDGSALNRSEALTPEEALSMFTPGGLRGPASTPALLPGSPADLCILAQPWPVVRRRLASARVNATISGGKIAARAARPWP